METETESDSESAVFDQSDHENGSTTEESIVASDSDENLCNIYLFFIMIL